MRPTFLVASIESASLRRLVRFDRPGDSARNTRSLPCSAGCSLPSELSSELIGTYKCGSHDAAALPCAPWRVLVGRAWSSKWSALSSALSADVSGAEKRRGDRWPAHVRPVRSWHDGRHADRALPVVSRPALKMRWFERPPVVPLPSGQSGVAASNRAREPGFSRSARDATTRRRRGMRVRAPAPRTERGRLHRGDHATGRSFRG